jgi:tRNA pseudouridine55 synthase
VIDGILPVLKQPGWTSHDVVARVRRTAGQRQVGHAGTLDPLAAGVLVLVLGPSTRLSSFLMQGQKVYVGEIVLGATTATDDAEAPVQTWRDPQAITRRQIADALSRFVGEIAQAPPRYAAVKRGGKKLYELARQGIDVVPDARPVTIHEIGLLAWDPPRLRVRVRCAPGTYLRSLARDVGEALGVGGYLHGLCRAASGSISVDDCTPLERLESREAITSALLPPDHALLHLPAVVLDAAGEAHLRQGLPIRVGIASSGTVRLYGASGHVAALGEAEGHLVRPTRVFPFRR